MVHRTFKAMVPHTNKTCIEMDLMRQYNTSQTLRHLVDGWKDPRFPNMNTGLRQSAREPVLHQILSRWYAINKPTNEGEDDTDGKCVLLVHGHYCYHFHVFPCPADTHALICHNSHFTKILLRKRWTTAQANARGWSHKINPGHPLLQDLAKCYEDLGSSAALLHDRIEYYDYISYQVFSEEGREPVHVRIHVGDVVEIQEEIEGLSFACIAGIIQHQSNANIFQAFFVLQWFQETTMNEPIVDCPIYNLQQLDETRWRRIFPITVVDNLPQVHFLHDCRKTCSNGHDEKIRRYIRNDFYYIAL